MFLPADEEGFQRIREVIKEFSMKNNDSEAFLTYLGGRARLGDKLGSSHWYPLEPFGIYDFEDHNTGELLSNDINREYMDPGPCSYHKLPYICLAYHSTDNKMQWHPCGREIFGRIFCEFKQLPKMRIKGLCEESLIDRTFQLIDPTAGQCKY